MYLQGGSNGIILRTNSGTNALTMDSSGNTTFAGNTTVTADPGKLGVGAAVNSNVGSSMDVIQVGFTSQWYAEKTDSAVWNVYIGNKFKMLGTECIRINLESSDLVLQTASFEQRQYNINIRYRLNKLLLTKTGWQPNC